MKSLTLFQEFAAAIISCCFVVMVVVTSLLICQCEKQPTTMVESGVIVNEDGPNLTKWPTPTFVPYEYTDPETGIEYTGFQYGAYHDEIGKPCVYGIMSHRKVAPIITMLQDEGFEFNRLDSKYNYIVGSDGEISHTLLLVYEQATGILGDRSTAVIRHTTIRGEAVSIQLEKMYIGVGDPNDVWTFGNDRWIEFLGCMDNGANVWTQSFIPWSKIYHNDPSQSSMLDPPDPLNPDNWDWVKYVACVVTEAVTEGAVGSAVCAFQVGPYDDCISDAHTSAATRAIVSCAIDQIW